MKPEKQYTQKQITESIVHWSQYMLENNMATEEELKSMLGESLFKRAVAGIKGAYDKTKDAIKSFAELSKEKIHDMFAPNKGVMQMLAAMNKIAKDGTPLDNVKIYANLGGKGRTIPVVGFAMANGKKVLLLLVNTMDRLAKPKTLDELRHFLVIDQKLKVKAAVDSIKCAEVTRYLYENIILESKMTDYISSNSLSKEDALKPETFKVLKKLAKQGDDKTKAAIEKYFAKKDAKSEVKKDTKKAINKEKPKAEVKKTAVKKEEPKKEPKKDDVNPQVEKPKADKEVKKDTDKDIKKEEPKTKKEEPKDEKKTLPKTSKEDETTAKAPKKEPETKFEPAGEPSKKDVYKTASPAKKEEPKKENKDTLKLFDNKLLDVKAEGDKLGFIFSKSKEEIALDKKYTDALSM